MLSRGNLAALMLTLLATGGLAIGARCTSATRASCSLATLTGDTPRLDVPYAGTRPEVVRLMLDLGKVAPGDRVIDLGTGDGRVLLAAGERGASGLGVDIDPVLVDQARGEAERRGLDDRLVFRTQDLFRTPLGGTDVLTMFLLPEINLRLRPRIVREMHPGARVVSHAFDMGDWPADAQARAGGARVYLWIVPARIAGRWRLTRMNRPVSTLVLAQRHQLLGGTIGTDPVEGRVAGSTVRFTTGGRVFEGRVDGRTMTGAGWRAILAD